MRRSLLAVLALVALASACEQSRIDPDASVEIGGITTSQNGEPVRGARVALSKEWDITEGLVTVASLGLACLNDDIEAACGETRVTDTDDAGAFSFELTGRETQGSFGQASTLEIAATKPAADDELQGPAVVQRFRVQTEALDLPLRFWEPGLEFDGDRQKAGATWASVGADALPGGADPAKVSYSLEFRDTRGRTIWRFPQTKSPRTFDARLLEDAAGDVAVFADADAIAVPEAQGKGVDVLLRSARLPYEGRAGVPDSRSKSCFTFTPDRKPIERSPCPLTDGEFHETLTLDDEPCPTACPAVDERQVMIDLGASLDIRLVTVRGCSPSCAVDTSGDATGWTRFAAGRPKSGSDRLDREQFFAETNENVALAAPRPTRARYVRVTTEDAIDELKEVSVFDPVLAPEPRAGRAPVPGGSDANGATTRWVLIAVGAALAALAAGLTFRRTRRPR